MAWKGAEDVRALRDRIAGRGVAPRVWTRADSLAQAREVARVRREQRDRARRQAAERQGAKLGDLIDRARDGDVLPLVGFQFGRVLTAEDVLAEPKAPRELTAAGERFVVLDWFQSDALTHLFDPACGRVGLKGCTGAGKSAVSGIGFNLFMDIWPDARAMLSRDTFHSGVRTLWAEMLKWRRMMAAPDKAFTVNRGGTMIDRTRPERRADVVNPEAEEGFRGTHAEHVLALFDEASSDAVQSKMDLADTQATHSLVMSNPSAGAGPFRRLFETGKGDPDQTRTALGAAGRVRLITVGMSSLLNVRLGCLDKPVVPRGGVTVNGRKYAHGDRLTPEDHAEVAAVVPGQSCRDLMLKLSAKERAFVKIYVEGRLADANPATRLFDRGWLGRHVAAWTRYDALRVRSEGNPARMRRLALARPLTAAGLDVGASSGGDASCLVAGGPWGIARMATVQIGDADELAAWVRETLGEWGADLTPAFPVGVDAGGVGWGLDALLRNQKVRTVEFNFGAGAADPKRYLNARAELYGTLARRLDPSGRFKARPFALPDSEDLADELTAHEKVFDGGGQRFGVTPKRKVPGRDGKQPTTIEAKIGRSPDSSDAAAIFHATLAHAGGGLRKALNTPGLL